MTKKKATTKKTVEAIEKEQTKKMLLSAGDTIAKQAKINDVQEKAIEKLKADLIRARAVNDAREAFFKTQADEVASRTMKLWFGYSLVKPAAKE